MKSLLLLTVACLLAASSQMVLGSDYASRDEVRVFVNELAREENFNEKELLSLFHNAEYKQNIIDAISRPAERTLDWARYQDIFLTEKRHSRGLTFMLENSDALAAAYKKYGVPPVIITAIIGVETMYGRITGGYRVLDALSTLAFDYPPRSKFFRSELKEFILLAREEKQMITDLTGSYAGAMGMGQFIPSSYRAYAVDFDDDGFRDIWNNPTDAIGSVANYLHVHGWRKDEDISFEVAVSEVPQEVFNVSLKPSKSLDDLFALGMESTDQSSDSAQLVSPMRLHGKKGDEYWIGMHNFYVITRYNHSKLYAMAVYQLSEGLRKGTADFASR